MPRPAINGTEERLEEISSLLSVQNELLSSLIEVLKGRSVDSTESKVEVKPAVNVRRK